MALCDVHPPWSHPDCAWGCVWFCMCLHLQIALLKMGIGALVNMALCDDRKEYTPPGARPDCA